MVYKNKQLYNDAINIKTPISSRNLNNIQKSVNINSTPTADKFQYIETLLENLFKEVKFLRHEVKELKTCVRQQSCPTLSSPPHITLNIPCKTKEEFEELERKIISDAGVGNILEGIFNNVCDQSLNKFISLCLARIITNYVAMSYSWYGKGAAGKIAVQEYAVMNIIKDCSIKKFPTARTTDFIRIATKWFHYAKCRFRKN